MDVQESDQDLECPLIGETEKEFKNKKNEIFGEVKRLLILAGPLMSVNFLLYCLQVISIMFVGHLGELSLSGASMATSFASVTGLSLLMGMGSALDTLCGQSYGAKQYHMLGIHMQRAMLVLLLSSVPLACIWANAGHILILLGQDPEIAAEAGSYSRYMIPTIFAYALLQCHIRFLQAQNNVVPMMFSAGITTLLHIFTCWILVFKSGLGNKGAALANAISYWINLLLLATYVRISPSCKSTWTGFSKEAFRDIWTYMRLAIPSAVMLCIRVSNELGAGRPQAACLAASTAVFLVATEGVVVAVILISVRKLWGYCYSTEEEVVGYVAEMLVLLAGSHFLDGIQSVLSGTARGCGWQKIGAVVNLGAYYLFGIPAGVILAFVYHFGGKGLWWGITLSLFAQALLLLIVTLQTNWEKEAKKAADRMTPEPA
ncbi:protein DETOXIFICATION 16-like isoform X2 [Lycium barbarum]|uniref:protein DETOXIFICATION 16-like isoform X2 n=1 Tax=Lycium barbarum TaxID=112863 RepID=UPI00293E671E|nr:protein DETOXIFICATION 16-like isoform X2 [Lycium barbarum]